MELDPTTFLLEIVNFLALLWILTRFLYRPVKSALAARAQAAAQAEAELGGRREALEARSVELDRQGQELASRRQAAERELASEMASLRQAGMTQLGAELDAERQKAHARLDQEVQKSRVQSDREARLRAAHFVATYLRRLASPALEAAVIEVFLADLGDQSVQAQEALRDGWTPGRGAVPAIDISTAFAPPAGLRERVEVRVNALMGQAPPIDWRIDPALLAGICVHLPGHSLEASLRRGVDAFAVEAA